MIRKRKDNQNINREKHAFTLVELLIVLLISFIVLAAAIPRIRMLSRDRAIRETSRIVGSIFTKAREEAVINGNSGVVLRRNSNFVADGQWYATTKLGILRAVPDYVGDQPFAKGATPSRGATRHSHNEVDIPIPVEQEDNPPVMAGDSISLNYSPAQFLIEEVKYDFSANGHAILRIKLDANSGTYPSIPPAFEDVPFAIHRLPILRRSSLEQLPGGCIIDLRYSGSPIFGSDLKLAESKYKNYEIEFIFDGSGSVDKILYWELNTKNVRTGRFLGNPPSSRIYLLVTETLLAASDSSLASDIAMWVTIDPDSTSPTVGYNTAQRGNLPAASADLEDIVDRARGNASNEASP